MHTAPISTALEHPAKFTFIPKAEFHPGWNKITGVTLEDGQLSIDPHQYFIRFEDPSWTYVPWSIVQGHWSEIRETPDTALEQAAVQFIAANRRTTSDPVVVMRNAEAVYSYLYDHERLAMYDDLEDVTAADLRVLRECSILCALNRAALNGRITVIGPAWYFAQCARTVFSLDRTSEIRVDELFHGGFYNGARLDEQVRAHVALGGKLVHGCQGSGNGAGGCVVQYGTDVRAMQTELMALRDPVIRAFQA